MAGKSAGFTRVADLAMATASTRASKRGHHAGALSGKVPVVSQGVREGPSKQGCADRTRRGASVDGDDSRLRLVPEREVYPENSVIELGPDPVQIDLGIELEPKLIVVASKLA